MDVLRRILNGLIGRFAIFAGAAALAWGLIAFLATKSLSLPPWLLEAVACGGIGALAILVVGWAQAPAVATGTAVTAASPVRFVHTQADLNREMFDAPDSVVQGAQSVLVAVGSRSRNPDYLRALARRVRETPDLDHLRVLIGPPQRDELRAHIAELKALRDLPGQREGKVTIIELPLGGEFPERFLCASERKAVIVSQSLTSPLSFDAGFVLEDPQLVVRMIDQLRAYAEPLARKARSPVSEETH